MIPVEYIDDGTSLFVKVDLEPYDPLNSVECDNKERSEALEFKRRFGRTWNPGARTAVSHLRLAAGLSDGKIRHLMSCHALEAEHDGVRLRTSRQVTSMSYPLMAVPGLLGLATLALWVRFTLGAGRSFFAFGVGVAFVLIALFLHRYLLVQPARLVKDARNNVARYLASRQRERSDHSQDRHAKAAETRNYNSALRIVRALAEMNRLNLGKPYAAGNVIQTQLENMGFTSPDSESIAKHLSRASELEPDKD